MRSCIPFVKVASKSSIAAYPRRARTALAAAAAVFAALLSGPPAAAGEATTVVTKYDLSLAGISLASFKFLSDLDESSYTISGRGDSSRLVKLIAKFKGTTKSAGALAGLRVVPASYSLEFRTGDDNQTVEMHFNGGVIDKLAVDPPSSPSPSRVPLEPAHRAGVLDPLSAVLLPLPPGKLDGNSVCDRRLPIFDGRYRYDLVFSYKRTETAPVAGKPQERTSLFVCKIKYEPIAGHKPQRASTLYWQNSEDIEIWLAPVTSAGMLVPYRALLPTPVGAATLSLSKLEISKQQRQAALAPAE